MNRTFRLAIYIVLVATFLLIAPWNAFSAANGGISGTVTAYSGGAAIQGMYVEAKPVDEFGNFDPTRSGTYKTYTESDGSYAINNLPPGDYKVIFNAGLAQTQIARQYVTQHYNGMPNWESATPVAVEGGSVTGGVDAAMQLGGTISGHVSGTAIATVFAIPVLSSGALDISRDMRQDPIDSSGNYTIVGLASGYYKLQAYQSGYVEVYYDGKACFDDADKVFVGAPGPVTGKNFTLVPGTSDG